MTLRMPVRVGSWAVAAVALATLSACDRGNAAFPDECQWHWNAFWEDYYAGVEGGAELARRVKFCVELGAGPNWRNPPTGWRTMHYATFLSLHGAPEAGDVMTYLVQGGADMEFRDKHGMTPLFMAAALTDQEILAVKFAFKNRRTLQRLLSYGNRGAGQIMVVEEMAEREILDAQYDEANRRRTIERLIRLGADPDARTDDGLGISDLERLRRAAAS